MKQWVKTLLYKYIDLGKKTKKGNGALDSIDKIPNTKPLLLVIKVVQAYNLKALDSNGLSDPFVFFKSIIRKKILQLFLSV